MNSIIEGKADIKQNDRAGCATPQARRPYYSRITSAQIHAIQNLAYTKQRSVPSSLHRWSQDFASGYIKFLLAIPFPKPERPRYQSETDMLFASQRRHAFGEYYSDGEDDVPVTRRLNHGEDLSSR